MSAVARRYLAAYDISDDRKRYRVVKCLLGFGDRVQKSVFEFQLGASGFREFLAAAGRLALDDGDSIRVYELDGGPPRLVRVFGRETARELPRVV